MADSRLFNPFLFLSVLSRIRPLYLSRASLFLWRETGKAIPNADSRHLKRQPTDVSAVNTHNRYRKSSSKETRPNDK